MECEKAEGIILKRILMSSMTVLVSVTFHDFRSFQGSSKIYVTHLLRLGIPHHRRGVFVHQDGGMKLISRASFRMTLFQLSMFHDCHDQWRQRAHALSINVFEHV